MLLDVKEYISEIEEVIYRNGEAGITVPQIREAILLVDPAKTEEDLHRILATGLGQVCRGGEGCGAVWCGVVWCGVAWRGAARRGAVWCGVVSCRVVWCRVVSCGPRRPPSPLREPPLPSPREPLANSQWWGVVGFQNRGVAPPPPPHLMLDELRPHVVRSCQPHVRRPQWTAMQLLLTTVPAPLSPTTGLAAGTLGAPHTCPATCGGVGAPAATHGTFPGSRCRAGNTCRAARCGAQRAPPAPSWLGGCASGAPLSAFAGHSSTSPVAGPGPAYSLVPAGAHIAPSRGRPPVPAATPAGRTGPVAVVSNLRRGWSDGEGCGGAGQCGAGWGAVGAGRGGGCAVT